MSKKRKKISIPKSVADLKLSVKKFAKKNSIKLKNVGKKEKKRNLKKLKSLYAKSSIIGLDKAVKIITENLQVENKKIEKVKAAIDNIITNDSVMKDIAKLYKKEPEKYKNLIYLPHMIINTLLYYSQDDLSDSDKAIGESLDKEGLMDFCKKILKKIIKRYKKYGFDDTIAFKLAEIVPSSSLLLSNRQWYKKLIQSLYAMAETTDIDYKKILSAVMKVDKKKSIKKNELLYRFYSEFILTKATNKTHTYTDTQKDLHESIMEDTLNYMEAMKGSKLRRMLKEYIRRRKTAEEYKNDSKRVFKFTDYATNNSAFVRIKEAVLELIADNSTNELYLG